MKKDIKIALIQTELHWQDPLANRLMFEKWFAGMGAGPDIVVLPEMFTTGFTMQAADFAEKMSGETVRWMRDQSARMQTHICGSVIIEEAGKHYNRLLWAMPDGRLSFYDKRHLFRMADEQKTYTAGRERLIVEVAGWKICPFICYDLRFPVWIRNHDNAYDLAIFVANWPEKRSRYWKLLLEARAVENQTWVAGVNRIGKDGNGFPHCGDSSIISPAGDVVAQYTNTPGVFIHEISAQTLEDCRRTFPVWRDADTFQIQHTSDEN